MDSCVLELLAADGRLQMRKVYVVFCIAMLFLVPLFRAQAQCPSGSNTTTSATYCSSSISLPNTNPDTSAPVAATPYPQAVTVSGMAGSLSSLKVTLSGFNENSSYPISTNIMLVAPNGAAIVFFGGDCGSNDQTFTDTLTFSDSGTSNPTGVPTNNFNYTCTNGATYRPYVNLDDTGGTCPTFPGATPASAACADGTTGAVTFASTFGGVNPNGTWKVYANIADDSENAGALAVLS